MNNKDTYVVMQRIGNCNICGKREDLRCGVCWTCQPQVEGEKISPVTHKLWDSKNPTNVWYYSENYN